MRRLSRLVYLLRVEFSTEDGAPIASPYVGETGSLTAIQNDGQFSVSSGRLNIPVQNTPARGDLVLYSPLYTRAAGLSMSQEIDVISRAGQIYPGTGFYNTIGSSLNNVSNCWHLDYRFQYNANVRIGSSQVDISNVSTDGRNLVFTVVLRSSGAFYIIGSKLYWVDNSQTSNVYAAMHGFSQTATSDYMRVYQMSAPWNDDYGIATNLVASPVVDTTTTSEANAVIEMTWQAVTGQTWELSTRRTDDNNRWIVRCDQVGSTVKLIERNAGVETERSSTAQTWTNGTQYRLVVIQDGNTISTYVANTAKNTYTSASFNNTATGVKTNKAGSNLVTYPRTLSGAALTELQRWTS